MKTKRVNRYYCDHCNKGGCNSGHMRKHEARCIRNPERVCGFCCTAEFEQQPIQDLIKVLAPDLVDLRKLSNDCPACILAAIVQSGRQTPPEGPDDPGCWFNFSFKDEAKLFWETYDR